MVFLVPDEDIKQSINLLLELSGKIEDSNKHFVSLLEKVESDDINTSKGLTFLEMKYQMLLSYMVNLVQIMYSKVSGKSIQEANCIETLVEIRTVLEKIRPIDQRLKYQIDKLIRTANTGSLEKDDPLRFKPNPGNLTSKLADEESDLDSEDEDRKGIYKPPKLSAVHYEGDVTEQDRQNEKLERARKKVLSSSIMRELHMEHHDGPEEIYESRDFMRLKEGKEERERTAYEEDRFIRLPTTSKKKATGVGLNTMSSLRYITHFDDIRPLTNEEGIQSSPKKRKSGGKLKGKKSSKKKKKFK